MAGSLYVVATPIGHLGDISHRALDVLAAVDLVVAEDTRHTGRLLAHFGIDGKLRSLHEHSDASVVDALIEALALGADMALVSDAGTPLLSDPGFELVRAARAAGVDVLPVPGASAAMAALSVAGLPTDRFRYCGFPPSRDAARRRWLDRLATAEETLVFYESAHRIGATLGDAVTVFGADRLAFLGREMTKRHEQYRLDTIEALHDAVVAEAIPARGEFCLLVAGAATREEDGDEEAARRLLPLLLEELPRSRAARIASTVTGVGRKRCYELAERLKSSGD